MASARKKPLLSGQVERVIGYARLSTVEQAQGNTLEQQISRLRIAGAQNIFYDLESGSKDDRVNLAKLLEECRSGSVHQVVITRIDRLSRRTRTVLEIAEELETLGIGLKALDQHVDTSTASGKMFLSVLASVSQFELDMLKERTQHGINYRKNKGNAMQTPPYGYIRVNRDGIDRLEPDVIPVLCDLQGRQEWSAWSLARWTVETYIATHSLRQTVSLGAKHFSFPPVPESNLRRWLLKPALRGDLVWNDGTTFPGTHQPLLDAETAKEVERLLALQSSRKGYGSKEAALTRPFTGRVFCALCGLSCTYQVISKPGRKEYFYYRCSRYGQGGQAACSNTNRVSTTQLDKATGEALCQRADALAAIGSKVGQSPELPEEVLRLQAELAQLESMSARSNIIESAIKDLKSKISVLTNSAQDEQQATWLSRQELVKVFSEPVFWETLDTADKRRFVQTFVRRVVIKSGSVETVELTI